MATVSPSSGCLSAAVLSPSFAVEAALSESFAAVAGSEPSCGGCGAFTESAEPGYKKKINSVLLMHCRVRGFTKKREIKHKIILISYHLILQVQDVTGKE